MSDPSEEQLDLFASEKPRVPDSSDRKMAPETPTLPITQHPKGPDAELCAFSRKLVSDIGLPDLAKVLKVSWNPRMRTTAGRAWFQKNLVELNPRLLEVSTEEIDRTLRHELAHLVAQHRAGANRIEPHGPEWKQACAELGIPGEDRCHNLEFERRKQTRKWAYDCPRCGKRVERVRRLKTMVACYPCCRTYNRGRFHERFKLRETRLES